MAVVEIEGRYWTVNQLAELSKMVRIISVRFAGHTCGSWLGVHEASPIIANLPRKGEVEGRSSNWKWNGSSANRANG